MKFLITFLTKYVDKYPSQNYTFYTFYFQFQTTIWLIPNVCLIFISHSNLSQKDLERKFKFRPYYEASCRDYTNTYIIKTK